MSTTVLPLIGKDLLAFVKANPNLNRSALAKQSGYTRIAKATGKPAANLLAFQDALLSAKGLELPGTERAARHSYEAYVQQSGALTVGAVYVTELGVGPADRFKIELVNDGERIGFFLALEERTEGSPLPIRKPSKRGKAEAPAAEAPAEASAASTEPTEELDDDDTYDNGEDDVD